MVHSEELPLYKARVVSLEDPDQKGRIRLRVLPQFKDVDETLLPWADPLIEQIGQDEFRFSPPQVGSMVWCVFTSPYWIDPYWLPSYFLRGFFDYNSVQSSLNEISELGDTDYPNVRFERLPQSNIRFYNAETGEMGTFHNSGSYSIFDADGNIILSSVGEVRLNGAEDYAVRFNALQEAFNQLRTDFNNLITAYNAHTHPDPSSGSTGPTSSPGSTSAADMSSAQAETVRLP